MLVTFTAAGPIGLPFGQEEDSSSLPLVVGAPATHPAIEVSSRLVTVNDVELFLYRNPYEKALELIRSAGRPLTIGFSPPNIKY